MAQFNDNEAEHIRTIRFRTPPFDLKLTVSEAKPQGGEQLRFAYTSRVKARRGDYGILDPLEKFQEQLDGIARERWKRKVKLHAVARAVAARADLCDPMSAPRASGLLTCR